MNPVDEFIDKYLSKELDLLEFKHAISQLSLSPEQRAQVDEVLDLQRRLQEGITDVPELKQKYSK